MPNIFKDSQFGFAISALQPNQALFIFDQYAQDTFDASSGEGKLLMTLGESEGYSVSAIPFYVKEIYLPKKTTTIEAGAAQTQTSLVLVERTENVTAVKEGAFAGCEKLKSINLNSVIRFGAGALAGCVALETVNLPNVETVDEEAFIDCINAEITLNDNVQSVGAGAFTNVKHLYYHGSLEGAPWGALAWN